jgi:O-antigen/teichoic acid export membrane protein
MQKKKFLSDLLFVQILNVLIKAFWILWIDREIQNYLPSDSYGQYYSILGFSVLFIILLDAGINNYNSRRVAKDNNFFQQNFIGIIAAKLALSVVYIIVAFVVAITLKFDQSDILVLALLLIFQIIASLNLYLRSNIAAHQQFKLDGFLGVLDRLLVIGICSLLLYHSSFQDSLNIHTFIIAQIIGVSVTFMLAFYINIKKLKSFVWNLKFRLLRDIVKEAFPYALLIILMGLFTRMDVVMLKALSTDHLEADLYAKAYRLLDAANMFAMILSGMLLPLFSKMIAENKSVSELVRISSKFLLLPAIPVILLLSLHSEYIMQLLYPLKYQAGLDSTFIFITISFFGYALVYLYGTLLTAKADLKFLNWSAAATALMNIALNLFLIPRQGALGAAKATLISQSMFALLCYLRANQVFALKLFTNENVRAIFAIGISAGIILLLEQFIEQPHVHILASLACTLIIYVIAKIFKPSELLQLLKR